VAAILQILFFLLVVKPLALIVLGMNVRYRHRLPRTGPAILVANHNSHLDTLALMSLFPLAHIRRTRPVAAADYFLRNRFIRWVSLNLIGIIPISRHGRHRAKDLFADIVAALDRGEVIILYPEGSRGEPERLTRFKTGLAHLIEMRPDVPVTPVFMHGLGKALPRGEALLVPFYCDVFVGKRLAWTGDRHSFMDDLDARMADLATEGQFAAWE
jgi:1-acyl-sn-glycerol-3-phosphate acyltransferase